MNLSYLLSARIESDTDPLKWWREYETTYPALTKVAKKNLLIPATSSPSEWVLSCSGNIVTCNRASLNPQTVDRLSFHRTCKKYTSLHRKTSYIFSVYRSRNFIFTFVICNLAIWIYDQFIFSWLYIVFNRWGLHYGVHLLFAVCQPLRPDYSVF